MQRIEKFIKTACAYTVAILIFFYLFAVTNSFDETAIGFGRFGLILLFGIVIALADYIFTMKISKLYTVLLHYCVLLFAFIVIFLISGVLGDSGSRIFISAIVFTILYAVLFAAVYFFKKGVSKLDNGLNKNHPAKKKEQKPKQNQNYEPKFKA